MYNVVETKPIIIPHIDRDISCKPKLVRLSKIVHVNFDDDYDDAEIFIYPLGNDPVNMNLADQCDQL
jgi:hypothetical protein